MVTGKSPLTSRAIGVTKARLPLLSTLMLAVLAGAFIGLGALNFMLVRSDPTLGFAARQLGGGVAFSLGLVLVVVAGAELFTGNNLLVMAWADRKITTAEVLRNWVLVCAGNFVGAAGLAVLVYLSGHTAMNNGLVAEQIVRIASAKCAMPLQEAFLKGVLCNLLVCMAVWMATAGRGVIDKVVAIVFPISAFVAAGFEHSIANFYLIPHGNEVPHDGDQVDLGETSPLLAEEQGHRVGGDAFPFRRAGPAGVGEGRAARGVGAVGFRRRGGPGEHQQRRRKNGDLPEAQGRHQHDVERKWSKPIQAQAATVI